jgi:hypothetical protein
MINVSRAFAPLAKGKRHAPKAKIVKAFFHKGWFSPYPRHSAPIIRGKAIRHRHQASPNRRPPEAKIRGSKNLRRALFIVPPRLNNNAPKHTSPIITYSWFI